MTIRDISGSDYINNNRRKTTGKLGKALEKLSSGFEINRAADDAARLAISEKHALFSQVLNRVRKISTMA